MDEFTQIADWKPAHDIDNLDPEKLAYVAQLVRKTFVQGMPMDIHVHAQELIQEHVLNHVLLDEPLETDRDFVAEATKAVKEME